MSILSNTILYELRPFVAICTIHAVAVLPGEGEAEGPEHSIMINRAAFYIVLN